MSTNRLLNGWCGRNRMIAVEVSPDWTLKTGKPGDAVPCSHPNALDFGELGWYAPKKGQHAHGLKSGLAIDWEAIS